MNKLQEHIENIKNVEIGQIDVKEIANQSVIKVYGRLPSEWTKLIDLVLSRDLNGHMIDVIKNRC
jgi:hypothetical protein